MVVPRFLSVFVAFAAFTSVRSLSPADALRDQEMTDTVARQGSDTDRSSASTECITSNGIDPATVHPPLYTESYRPQIHFSPSTGFMNDPNGLVMSGETWHMYYQYNPRDTVAGFQHWGHASSKDLYTWQTHPPAIAPANDSEGIFSGSAVLDVNNTSGFFHDSTLAESRFVAIYTLNTPTSQDQNIAFSTDGQNYTKYDGNPVISLNTTQFRDPKVFWDEQKQHWVMAVAHPQDFQVGFYSSSNLRRWTEMSRFGPSGILGYQYECPDLVQVPIQGGQRDGQMAWVLVLSINPGAPLGGSFVQTFIGDWDGTAFKPWDGSVQTVDFGKDFYAPQTFYNAPDGQAVMLGWASNWQYTNTVPSSPWRNAMSVPRLLHVRWIDMNPMHGGYQLTAEPFGLDALTKKTLTESERGGNQTVALDGNGAFDIQANFSLPASSLTSTNPRAEIRIATANEGEYLNVGILFADPITVYIDRRFAGRQWSDSDPLITDRFSQQLPPLRRTPNDVGSDLLVNVHMIVDRTLTEVFVQNGVASATVLHYWNDDGRPSTMSVVLGNDQIKLDSLKVDSINSTWPSCP